MPINILQGNRDISIMTDNIKINPFTNIALSAAEIQQLDANNDGIVTKQELYSNTEFIAKYASQDAEGDVQIENEDSTGLATVAAGTWELAKSPVPLIGGAIKGGVSIISGVAQQIWSVGKGSVTGCWELVKGVGGFLGNTINGGLRGVKSVFNGFINGWGQIFKGNIFGGLGSMIKGVGNLIWQPIKGIGKGIAAVGKGIINGVKKVGKGIVNGVKKVGEGIGKAAKAIGKGIGKAAKAIGKGIKKIFSGW